MSDRIQSPDAIGPAGKSENDKEEILSDPAKADYKAGREFLDRGEYAQAAMALHNALCGFEEQGNEQGVANAADRLGDVCMARDEYEKALDHFDRALAICEKEYDIFSKLALNNKRADAYRKLGDSGRTLEVLFDIFDHYTEARNPRGTVEILETIAEVYVERGEHEKAADSLRTIASIHKNFKHARQAEEFENRARLLVEQG